MSAPFREYAPDRDCSSHPASELNRPRAAHRASHTIPMGGGLGVFGVLGGQNTARPGDRSDAGADSPTRS